MATAAIAALMSVFASVSHAEASVPWSPSAYVRHDIELLVDQGGLQLPVTHWPLPSGAVRGALSALPTDLPEPLKDARSRVIAALDAATGALASITLRGGRETPAGFGDDATSGSNVGLRSPAINRFGVAAQIGLRADATAADRQGGAVRLDQSAAAVEGAGIQLTAFAHRSWWGPGWDNALAQSDNTPPLVGASLQRAAATRSESPWLSWLGPWSAELFIAKGESGATNIAPHLVGNRVTLKPFSNLEIGFTRMLQWGGSGRNNSVSSLLKALAGGNTNIEDRSNADQTDSANQLAGADLRYTCGFGLRCAAYTEIIGEDRYKILPKKLIGTYGIETWTADGRHRFIFEYTDTECGRSVGNQHIPGCAYRNGIFPGGYTQGNRWVGANIGPDSRILTFGWIDRERDQQVRVNYGDIGSRVGQWDANSFQSGSPYMGRLIAVSARRSFHYGTFTLSPEAGLSRLGMSGDGKVKARVGLVLERPL